MNINSYDIFFSYSFKEKKYCSEIILTHVAITDAITNGLADFVKKSAKKGKKVAVCNRSSLYLENGRLCSSVHSIFKLLNFFSTRPFYIKRDFERNIILNTILRIVVQ